MTTLAMINPDEQPLLILFTRCLSAEIRVAINVALKRDRHNTIKGGNTTVPATSMFNHLVSHCEAKPTPYPWKKR